MKKTTVQDIANELMDPHKTRNTLSLAIVAFALVCQSYVDYLCARAACEFPKHDDD